MNKDLGKTQITKDIRVSSAMIHYDFEPPMGYFQYETWIFSSDPTQRSRQIIHGANHWESDKLVEKTKKVHQYVSENLIKRFLNG